MISVEQSPHLMTPDQAKLKSVHRLKWMLSNGFWGLGEQTLSNSFAGTSIPWAGVYAPQSRWPSRRPIRPALPSRRLTKGTLVDLRQESIRCSPEIHQMCTRNPSDVRQECGKFAAVWPTVRFKEFFQKLLHGCEGRQHLAPARSNFTEFKGRSDWTLNNIVHLIAHLIICISVSIYLIFERAAWRLIMCLLVGFSKGFEPVRLVRRTQAKVTCLPYLTLKHRFNKIFFVRVLEIFVLFTNSM